MAREISIKLSVHMAWWWAWIYMPLTRFGAWLGLPLNLQIVLNDTLKAMKIEVHK